MLVRLCTTTAAAAAQPTDAELIATVEQHAAHLAKDVLSFWKQHGLDEVHGGFHGTLDRYGEPSEPTAKGLVQQARHVW